MHVHVERGRRQPERQVDKRMGPLGQVGGVCLLDGAAEVGALDQALVDEEEEDESLARVVRVARQPPQLEPELLLLSFYREELARHRGAVHDPHGVRGRVLLHSVQLGASVGALLARHAHAGVVDRVGLHHLHTGMRRSVHRNTYAHTLHAPHVGAIAGALQPVTAGHLERTCRAQPVAFTCSSLLYSSPTLFIALSRIGTLKNRSSTVIVVPCVLAHGFGAAGSPGLGGTSSPAEKWAQ